MRKALIVLAAVLALLFIAILLVPVLFKDRILAALNGAISDQVDANVTLGDATLGVLGSFPDVSVDIAGLKVVNKAPFDGVVLADVGQIHLVLDLMSVVGGGTVEVVALDLVDPHLNVVVDPDGHSNTDIAKKTPATPAPTEAAKPYSLRLTEESVQNLDLVYDDQQGGTRVDIRDLDHKGSGKINQDNLHLLTHTDIAAMSLHKGGVDLLTESRWAADVDLDLNQATGQMSFGASKVSVNDLAIGFQGSVLPKGMDDVLDLSFSALQTSFGSVLSLIPSVYKAGLAGDQVSGTLALSGSVKGTLAASGDDLPAFDLALQIKDGHFKRPDLPTGIDAVQLDLALHHPDGPVDLLETDLRTFHIEVAGSPLDGHLKLRHPTTDPDIDAQVQGRLDLASLRAALPPSDLSYKGTVDLDVDVAGRVSQFEASQFDAVRAKGIVQLTDTAYADPTLPGPIQIDRMKLTLDPQHADLADFVVHVGASDLSAQGTADNLVPYLLTDAPLKGRMALTSTFLDLDALSGDSPANKSQEKSTSTITPIPKNLDLAMTANFARVRYDGNDLTHVVGTLSAKNGVLTLGPMTMGLLGGDLSVNGTYAAPTAKSADVDIAVKMDKFTVSNTVAHIDTLAKLAPIAKGASGTFNSSFQLKTRLGHDLSPDLATLFSKGNIRLLGVSVVPAFMDAVSSALQNAGIKGLDLNNSNLLYKIENGRVNLDGDALKVGGFKAALSGSTGTLDQTLALNLDLTAPVSEIKAADLLSSLGVGKTGDVKLRIKIGGTFDKPTVKVQLADGTVASLQDVAAAALGPEAQKLLDDAKAEGDQLIAAAQKVADQLSAGAKTAGDQLIATAKKQGDKLKADAKGNSLQLAAAKAAADQLNKTAKTQAAKLQSEADKKGQAGVDAAKKQATSLLAQAQAKLDAAGGKQAGVGGAR